MADMKKNVWKDRPCDNCGEPIGKNDPRARTCSIKCKRDKNNRRMMRGAKIYEAAMSWRINRESESFTVLCQLLDDFAHEDKQIGPHRATYRKVTPKPAKQVGVANGNEKMPRQPGYVVQR